MRDDLVRVTYPTINWVEFTRNSKYAWGERDGGVKKRRETSF